MSVIRAVIFDIYGTLLDSAAGDMPPGAGRLPDPGVPAPADLLERFHQAILSRHAASPLPYPEVDVVEIWAELLPELPPGRVTSYAREAEEALNPVSAMPGARETLAALKARGLPLGLVSNAQRFIFSLMTDHLGEPWVFDPALCRFSWQEGRAKPDPWLFESLRHPLGHRGIASAEVLYVGNDVAKDIRPASQCGFRTALLVGSPALRWRGATRADCDADLLIGDLRELLLPSPRRPELRYFP